MSLESAEGRLGHQRRGRPAFELRTLARASAGLALAVLAVHRAAAAVGRRAGAATKVPAVGASLDDATPIQRRLAPQGRCAQPSVVGGMPVLGVRYTPHLVGEPYPHPESEPGGFYSEVYAHMHARDLPLIGGRVGADTLALRPWPADGSLHQRAGFFEEMMDAGICKAIPTFNAAKYYADMLREGRSKPETDPSSPLAVDFSRFGATVDQGLLGGVDMVAWTVDLSLDLKALLPLVGDKCTSSKITQDKSFQRYIKILTAIQRWVHPGVETASVAPALAAKPFLLPLDISRVSWYEPLFQERLNTFMECMGKDVMNGGWSTLFSYFSNETARTRWLFSFGDPVHQHSTYDFRSQLRNISFAMTQRALVMAGTQALSRGSKNPINSVNLREDFGVDNARYQKLFEDYNMVSNETQRLDGFIYDEWMDDWDRGARGPFFLTAEDLPSMRDPCFDGGRFSHDVECSRVVGHNGHVYPEFFGLSGSSSQAMTHCVHPRFSESLFGSGSGDATKIAMRCATMAPNYEWMATAVVLLLSVLVIQVSRMCIRWGCRSGFRWRSHNEQESARAEDSAELRVGYVTIRPDDKTLCGEHQIELQSTRLRSNEEAGWWLWTHVSSQMSIMEKQVQTEVAATRGLRGRRAQMPQSSKKSAGSCYESETSEDADDVAVAMRVVHRRTLEGFASWCTYVAQSPLRSFCGKGLDTTDLRTCARAVEENAERPAARLFVEALLLRTMESLGEQILQCPERLSFLLFHIFQDAGGLEDIGPVTLSIDLDRLQDGLPQMAVHSNPYVRKKMPSGKWELGLNFDDINESGIQCRANVAKTYKEPASIMVIIDFALCYRVPFMLKLYCLGIAGYIYLGSHMGDDLATSHNGSMIEPQWLRINYIQYTAVLDALIWACTEALLIVYTTWQRWPSLCHRSPGIPGLKWLMEHLFNFCISVLAGLWVYNQRVFMRKPWACSQSEVGECIDPRLDTLFSVIQWAFAYWVCRAILFVVMNMKQVPVFIHGTPDRKVRKESGRGCLDSWALDLRVFLAWFSMLGACIVVEVVLLLPAMKGLDFSTTCGNDLLGSIFGMPEQQGVCSEADQMATFKCVTCLGSVGAGWSLVFLGSMVDVYFIFYLAAAVVGSVMGHRRDLNDLKNTSLPIDLRENKGREALLFERTFGPGWQHIWRTMVKSLMQESFISPKQAMGLVQAAGVTMEGESLLTHRDRVQKPIHLTRFPGLAAERLAFFFQSLKWIEKQGGGKGTGFEPSTDSLTGEFFDVGTIPSLTQIIPAYNEVVIPAVEFLKSGADPEDARNGSPDDQPGLGDLTVPPQGDGVNTNLAFMISQFPDEWVFLTKRLHLEGWIERAESQDLYQDFMKGKLSAECVQEVRLWAALRMQSVSKTVIGALQYSRALAALPKIKQYYAQFPEKRIAEDHVEVILAHQTYGHSEGSEKNDEAVQMLLERYADDPLVLVFDLKKGSSPDLWRMVESFLSMRGGYIPGSFEQASVKCRWDKARRGLRVLEVLPRKFPLRLGVGEFKTQGKACNQLNGLRFAAGHFVQALDCNMGTFIGEGFKVPYVLRTFMPLDKEDRTAPKCRYLGFREYIYTGREGTVGKCHAAAEWTFGTIYQRFLTGLGIRMHYGHPDFLDGFWARNRGGMSKSSPVVNLSEDIFAGFNVRMREEKSPHIDALEFEKGREATFNAASNFFSKISGGSISVIRSRDNHLLCERIGVLHSLSFYFTSVAFYSSNLMVDLSIYLYVILFILFRLAGLGPGELSALGSTFSTEWIISMGLVTLVPQVCEMVLEHGAVHAVREVFGGLLSATFFFIFQNKNIASSMKEGAMTGIARYFFTGRPPANQHQTWKDIYVTYWKSHYKPAFFLCFAYLIYTVLAAQEYGRGKLPMVLVATSFIAWVVTPIIFSPFPRWILIRQDLQEFSNFITGGAGTGEDEIKEVVDRGKKCTVRSLFECGLADEMAMWTESAMFMLILRFIFKVLVAMFVVVAVPTEVLDFLPIFLVALSCSWVVVLGYFVAGLNNVFLVLSFLVWPAAVPFAHLIVGNRWSHPSPIVRLPEYVISMCMFFCLLGLVKEFVLILCRVIQSLSPCMRRSRGGIGRMHECVRICFVYFLVHQVQFVEAYIVLLANLVTSCALAVVDKVFCNAHTWFLLNSELARTKHGERYMEKNATFFEMDSLGYNLDIWGSDSESEASPREAHDTPSQGPWA